MEDDRDGQEGLRNNHLRKHSLGQPRTGGPAAPGRGSSAADPAPTPSTSPHLSPSPYPLPTPPLSPPPLYLHPSPLPLLPRSPSLLPSPPPPPLLSLLPPPSSFPPSSPSSLPFPPPSLPPPPPPPLTPPLPPAPLPPPPPTLPPPLPPPPSPPPPYADPRSHRALCCRHAVNASEVANFNFRSVREARQAEWSRIDACRVTGDQIRRQMANARAGPKPCPEQPAATNTPPMLSTGEITGTASGVQSIYPPQEDTMPASATVGNRAFIRVMMVANIRLSGAGSRTRMRSKGLACRDASDGVSPGPRRTSGLCRSRRPSAV